MPRVSRAQADLNRQTIEEVSARLFREQGINGVSVADLMGAAGLTHGGFYGHFSSKDDLAALACAKAFEQSGARWRARVDESDNDVSALRAIARAYLSRRSRDNPGSSCPSAALAIDVSREADDKPVRKAYAAGINQQVDLLASLQHTGDETSDRQQALVQLSMLVGALVLARGTRGDPVSAEVMNAVCALLAPNDSTNNQ